MTAATGPPETMADRRTELTPMLRQYFELCVDHPDALVLFQVGDFYEAFCEAAETVARICEVTLTKREDSTGSYPMAGVPIDNAASSLDRLVDAGYRVAIADQVEDAAEANGLVDRAVTRVLTPGTVVDEELLAAGTTNYVATVVSAGDRDGGSEPDSERTATDADGDDARTDETATDGFALAALDVSTGECLVTSVSTRTAVEAELDRLSPAELLVADDAPTVTPESAGTWTESVVDADRFDLARATDRLGAYTAADRLASDAERRACGAVLAYGEYTQGDDAPLEYVSRIQRYDRRDSLAFDAAARRSLELFESRSPNSSATLFETVDQTASALGRRCLTRWLRQPLVDRERIEQRLDAVEALVADGVVRERLHDQLGAAYDLERLAGRISRRRANGRDLRALKRTLDIVPELDETLSGLAAFESYRDRLDPLDDCATLIDDAIVSDPPAELTEGGVINPSFDSDLDALRSTERAGRNWIAELEASERERTGIDSLSVGHTQVHGYYIEVTNPNLDRVPDDYTRRQTLKNSERFYTPELKRREDEILGAAERADSLEYDLFCDVRDRVAAETDRIQALARVVGELDALCSLATAAAVGDYVRPSFQPPDSRELTIEGGRHPVVETTRESFVPNDTDLAAGEVAIITGPNMSGKSTYMRQVALISVLAQIGSFVPAEAARLPIFDRIFTRVGASDDIAGGESTFMREMSELTAILHDATDRSLVLLDEVGRGTSTTDGAAIARATTEFIHDELDAITLFATHYHELTTLADERAGVFNLHFAATREDDDVTFLHRIVRGPSGASYGIEVAELAGVPPAVVSRAREVVDESNTVDPAESTTVGDGSESSATGDGSEPITAGDGSASASAGSDTATNTRPTPSDAPAATDAEAVAEALAAIDIARMTPIEALNTLDELQSAIDDR